MNMFLCNFGRRCRQSIVALLAAIFLVACGSSSSTGSNDSPKISDADIEVDSYKGLPSCTEKREGTTAYVVDQEQGYVCENGKWVEDDAAVDIYSSSSAISSSSSKNLNENSEPVKIDEPSDVVKGTMTDSRDGQTYRTVKIGDQVWMAENLNYDYKVNGNSYGSYTNQNCDTCGHYYTWAAAMDSAAVFSMNGSGCGLSKKCTVKTPARGICPEGWHIPTSSEWETLYSAIGGSPDAMLAKGYDKWPDATDDYGFSALPAGYYYGGSGYDAGENAFFWSATEYNDDYACLWYIYASYPSRARLGSYDKYGGYSVRCVKDSPLQ